MRCSAPPPRCAVGRFGSLDSLAPASFSPGGPSAGTELDAQMRSTQVIHLKPMKTIRFLGVWLVLCTHTHAAEAPLRCVPQPGCKVSVKGNNTVHEWRITGGDIGGWIELASGRMSGTAVIPVRSLSCTDGMTKAMHQLLKQPQCSLITFIFTNAPLTTTQTREPVQRLDARGALTVAGVTNHLAVPIDVAPLNGHRFRLKGKTTLKMSSYSIQPPLLLVSGTEGHRIRYSDEVEVSFDWVLGPKPDDAKSD